jgi:hypothetical protein
MCINQMSSRSRKLANEIAVGRIDVVSMDACEAATLVALWLVLALDGYVSDMYRHKSGPAKKYSTSQSSNAR